MTTAIRVTGLRETVRRLERMGVDAADLKTAFRQISDEVVREAVGIVPTVTGTLAGSIRPGNTKNKAVVRAGRATAPYAGVINYGWPSRGIAATEFLTGPANKDPAAKVRTIERNLDALIKRHNLD